MKLTKSAWEDIGKQAGWMKKAESDNEWIRKELVKRFVKAIGETLTGYYSAKDLEEQIVKSDIYYELDKLAAQIAESGLGEEKITGGFEREVEDAAKEKAYLELEQEHLNKL